MVIADAEGLPLAVLTASASRSEVSMVEERGQSDDYNSLNVTLELLRQDATHLLANIG